MDIGGQKIFKTDFQKAVKFVVDTFESKLGNDPKIRECVHVLGDGAEHIQQHLQNMEEAQKAEAAPTAQASGPEGHIIIPEEAPWQISTGSKTHACFLATSNANM